MTKVFLEQPLASLGSANKLWEYQLDCREVELAWGGFDTLGLAKGRFGQRYVVRSHLPSEPLYSPVCFHDLQLWAAAALMAP